MVAVAAGREVVVPTTTPSAITAVGRGCGCGFAQDAATAARRKRTDQSIVIWIGDVGSDKRGWREWQR